MESLVITFFLDNYSFKISKNLDLVLKNKGFYTILFIDNFLLPMEGKLKLFLDFGGENGIRTHEKIAPLHAFQACAFNHSATSPLLIANLIYYN